MDRNSGSRGGSIAFANWAFADMIGYTPGMVQGLTHRQIFGATPEGESPMAVMRANAELVIELAHLDGSIVPAKVSGPLLVGDDEAALATFHDKPSSYGSRSSHRTQGPRNAVAPGPCG